MKTFLLLLALCLPVFGQSQSQTFDLGPPTFNTQPQANGYQWIARGDVYPGGTFSVRPQADDCAVPNGAQPVGKYAIFGRFGAPGEHIATYRLTFGKVSYFFDGYARVTEEEENDGMPLAFLFDVFGSAPAREPTLGRVEFVPRSAACFGGQVRLFLTQQQDHSRE